MAHNRYSRGFRCGLVSMMALVSACSGRDDVTAPSGDPSTFFATLAVREKAVTLTLVPSEDAIQLHVTALFGDGSPVAEPPRFVAGDSTITVDSTGVVRALFRTTNLAVVRVSVTHAGLTRRDSVRVRVLTATPTVRMDRVTISRPPGANDVIPLIAAPTAIAAPEIGQQQLQLTAFDLAGTPVPASEIVIAAISSDTTIATVDQTGMVTARRPGRVFITATAAANGVFSADSVPITVGPNQYAVFEILSPHSGNYASVWRLGGDTARIAVGGTIQWNNDAPDQIDLFLDDTTHLEPASTAIGLGFPDTGKGHVLGLGTGDLDCSITGDFFGCLRLRAQARKFMAPGVYHFYGVLPDSTITNRVRGVVIVCATDALVCNP